MGALCIGELLCTCSGRSSKASTTITRSCISAGVQLLTLKMASKYTLHYFNLPGRAEAARLLFHLAGVEFTDHIISFAEWSSSKSDTAKFPLGQLPSLEVNGEVICQSRAINRFIAEELNLYGSSNMDRSLIDQAYETIMEIKEQLYTIKFKD